MALKEFSLSGVSRDICWNYTLVTQLVLTCSKLTIETLEQGVNKDTLYFNKKVSLLLTLNIFHTFHTLF